MILTLSERRLSELIRSLEGINDTDSEIAFRMNYYAGRLFAHVSDGYGIRMVGMSENHGDLASFQFSISGVWSDWQTGAFNWDRLIGGLQFLNPVAISLDCDDIEEICDGLVATAMSDNFEQYEHELRRISVGGLQAKIESLCLKYAWGHGVETTALSPNDRMLQELELEGQFARAGLVDPALKSRTIQEFREREAAEYQAAEQKRKDDFYRENYNR